MSQIFSKENRRFALLLGSMMIIKLARYSLKRIEGLIKYAADKVTEKLYPDIL